MPGHPPRTLMDAVWHPLRALFSQKGAWGFRAAGAALQSGRRLRLELVQRVHDQGRRFFARRTQHRRQSEHDHINHDRRGLRRLDLHALGYLQVSADLRHRPGVDQPDVRVAGGGRKEVWLLALATSLDTGIGGMGQAAFVAFLVSLCSSNFSATQYALLSALASLPRISMGSVAGFVVAKIGWADFFVVTCLTAVPGLILLVILRGPLKPAARHAMPRTPKPRRG